MAQLRNTFTKALFKKTLDSGAEARPAASPGVWGEQTARTLCAVPGEGAAGRVPAVAIDPLGALLPAAMPVPFALSKLENGLYSC